MIRVTIEMVPMGIESMTRHMATIEIANDVSRSIETGGTKGDYTAKLSRISQRGEHLGWYDKTATARGIARNRSGAVYRILHGVLADFLGESK